MLSRKTRQQVLELLETVDAGLVRFPSATEKAAMLGEDRKSTRLNSSHGS